MKIRVDVGNSVTTTTHTLNVCEQDGERDLK